MTTQVVASAFRDEKLYTVVLDTTGMFGEAGPVSVLSGQIRVPAEFVNVKID